MPRNVWHYRVDLKDIWRNEAMTFEERRDEIVRRIRASSWFKQSDEHWSPLRTLLEELSEAEDFVDFDAVWNNVYDEADADRCWIATF